MTTTVKGPIVLVVHCVDTEGPIGGDVRRREDGSKEFLDNWSDISLSLRRLTNNKFRSESSDSFGNRYLFNWFIMDFTGFQTNPKRRIAKYHDTYDHLKALPTKPDGFYWHHHHPPADGQGDQWSASWDSSNEYLNILLHRLVEREVWPEAYRAGGTIEDNAQSRWLEDTMMIDYSNRVSDRSFPTRNIFDFNWHGAPDRWGYYHPSRRSLVKPGTMRRFIVRSVDLWSRLQELTVKEVEKAFEQAKKSKRPVILSYFSHDHRDMNDETRYAIQLIKLVSRRYSIPWRSCTALEAVQLAADIKPEKISVRSGRRGQTLELEMNKKLYQPVPWVGAQLANGELKWLTVAKVSSKRFTVNLEPKMRKVVIGGTSLSGDTFISVVPRKLLR